MKRVYCFSDGGSRGNPGQGAIGIAIYDENMQLLEAHKEKIGLCTNNQAEYTALIKALELASKYTKQEIVCTLDSELVVKQLNGEYKIKDSKLSILFSKVKESEKIFLKVVYKHEKRENSHMRIVDGLVNQALDS